MSITVEFFGLARQCAGCQQTIVEANSVGQLIEQLTCDFPDLAEICFAGKSLTQGFILNLNGQRFTRDVSAKLHDGDSVLILSADAGG